MCRTRADVCSLIEGDIWHLAATTACALRSLQPLRCLHVGCLLMQISLAHLINSVLNNILLLFTSLFITDEISLCFRQRTSQTLTGRSHVNGNSFMPRPKHTSREIRSQAGVDEHGVAHLEVDVSEPRGTRIFQLACFVGELVSSEGPGRQSVAPVHRGMVRE